MLGKHDSPYIGFLNLAERVSLARANPEWYSPDSLLVAIVIEPRIVLSQKSLNVHPVTEGEARGSVLVDYYGQTGRINNTNVVFRSNATLFKEVLVRYLSCEEIPC